MRFNLDYQPSPPGFNITHKSRLFLIGSCFSEHITAKLNAAGFQTLANPFGISYNLFSLFSELESAINSKKPDADLLIERDGSSFTLEAHSSVSAKTPESLSEIIIQRRLDVRKFLTTADFIFITPGTAWYYLHKKTNKVVANCQKQNATVFEKKLASIEELHKASISFIETLHKFNPNVKVIFTLSPVRHLRDGLENNLISKSTLRLALHQICTENPGCSYFPAFEFVNEDLKDYRFYEADLAHPNQLAIEYVWEKFSKLYFNETTAQIAALFEERTKALNHRQMGSEASDNAHFKQHLQKLDEKIAALIAAQN